MAASMEALKTEYECPIHLELLQEPMILKCLHHLCKEDVDRMTDGGVIQCPTCNAVSDVDDVKHDFHAQKVLDILRAQEESKRSTSGKLVCGACNKADATAKCYTCDMYLDPDCSLGHSRMKFSEPHRIESFVQIKDRNRAELRVKLELLDKRIARIDRATASNKKIELEIEKQDAVTHAKLEELHERLKLSLAKKFAELSTSVTSRKQERIAGCREVLAKLSASKQNTELERESVSNAINGDDDVVLGDDYVMELISQSANVLQSCDQALLDASKPRPESEWILPETESTVHEIEALAVKEFRTKSEQPRHQPRSGKAPTKPPRMHNRPGAFSLTSLLNNPVTPTERYKCKDQVWNIQRVGDKIWAMIQKYGTHTIRVLQYREGVFAECKTIRVYRYQPIPHAIKRHMGVISDDVGRYALGAVMLTRYGIIGSCEYQDNKLDRLDFVSSRNDIGLVVLGCDGRVENVIAKGPYHHVDIVDEIICGLGKRYVKGEYVSDMLTLHTQQQDGWVQLREINYDRKFDTVFASHDYLYFTGTFQDRCIFKKKLNDERHNETLVVPYTNKLGKYFLYIYCVDIEGNVLGADYVNNKLIVFQAGDPPQARIVETSRELASPGIGFEVNNEVIILERGSNRIISFKVLGST